MKGSDTSEPRPGRGDSATLRGTTRCWSFQGSGEGRRPFASLCGNPLVAPNKARFPAGASAKRAAAPAPNPSSHPKNKDQKWASRKYRLTVPQQLFRLQSRWSRKKSICPARSGIARQLLRCGAPVSAPHFSVFARLACRGELHSPDKGRPAGRPYNRNHRSGDFLRDHQLILTDDSAFGKKKR
jgi:hypothetical protein